MNNAIATFVALYILRYVIGLFAFASLKPARSETEKINRIISPDGGGQIL
jgi:hypothetical protein